MTSVHGIDFRDDVAPLVQELVDRMIDISGPTRCFNAHGQIKFALRSPAESKGGRAYRLFLQIKPDEFGAVAKRPRVPQTGGKVMPLNDKLDVEKAIRAASDWFQEVKSSKKPRDYQGTGDPRVFPGGQVESNRTKH